MKKLLQTGVEVVVYDLMIYGAYGLPKYHPNLTVVKGDIRNTPDLAQAIKGCDAMIHLACISNDPSFELDPVLSKSVNYDCFEAMVVAAKAAGVKRFIYASTSSVYGVSDAPEVTEEHPLVPLTDYNKYKGLCEPLLLKHQSSDFTTVIIRPATICGYSPRMRLDLSVNIFTNLAVNKGAITVFGGLQKRPNIHIEDISDLYIELLRYPAEKIAGKTFNAAYQNHTINELAEMTRECVAKEFPEKDAISIVTSASNDPRSYHISAKKIEAELGWVAKRSVADAISDVCQAFRAGKLPNSLSDPRYFNVQQMKDIALV